MATVELIPPPEPEKQVVIRLSMAEAGRLLDAIHRAGFINYIGDGGTSLGGLLSDAGVRRP